MKTCANCKQTNTDDNQFCTNCGKPLTEEAKEDVYPYRKTEVETPIVTKPTPEAQALELMNSMDESLKSIKSWVKFFGIVFLIALLLNLLFSCMP
jgi:uncharacterized membrane protein YvbJ